jgi:putative glutamine amidotransferase
VEPYDEAIDPSGRGAVPAMIDGPTAPARPLIGVTTSELRQAQTLRPIPEGEPQRREMALGLTYMRALEEAGGIPLVIPPMHQQAIEPLLGRLDGLCLSGGPDLDPETYGAMPHPELGPVEPDADRFELALATCADETGIPILAICRGTQALTVVRGGTLHQHLPDLGGEIVHRRSATGGEPVSHPIEVEGDSRLAAVLGRTELEVNSYHHQAVDRLGEGLRATARAPDGTVEAIEDPRRDFLIGVQWHAESDVHRACEAALFRAFVGTCREVSPQAAARTG